MAANCRCCEAAALSRRVFVVDEEDLVGPAYDEYMWMANRVKLALSGRRVLPVSLLEAVSLLSKAKRRRYLDAYDSLQVSPVSRKDARVEMFIKADKVDHCGLEAKKPRAIQGRNPRYNLELATHMKPIEHALMSWKGLRRGVVRTRVFAKGLDAKGRASLIIKKTRAFARPCVVSLDAHSMDASVLPVHLECNDACYLAMCPGSGFERLLSWRKVNIGRTSHGIRYSLRGNRMSGDLDTGIGNSLISYVYISAAMRYLGLRKWDILCDGDDVLLFMDGRASMVDLKAACLRYGFDVDGDVVEIKSEEDLCHVEFCRSRIVWTPRGHTLCRNPARALACFGVSHRFASVPLAVYRRYLKGCAMCESHASWDLPLLGPWAWTAYTSLEGKPILDDEDMWRGGVHLSDPRAVPSRVHPKTRRHFELAFGFSVEQQLEFESRNDSRAQQMLLEESTTEDAVVYSSHYLWLNDVEYLM